ncbi:MAG: NAD(P)-dependent oxidoreductase [Desulfobacterales bacterium]|jgi:3-hydroxyisobutyrate dehydrogenase-like beta-hydroxyacid dehydrogenase|nr:NAD(P)-dependent oxidoreductase [Deltaproteobacteria bacterium]
MKIGFIGVGAMGGGLARNLIRAGKEVLVYDLNPEAVNKTLEAGSTGKAANQLQELATADIVFTSLPLPQHLEETMLGETGLLNAMRAGATYIDVSTIDPQTARKLATAAETAGVKFLECPLGKTPAQAETAEEPIFVGGDEAIYQELKPILEIIGNPVYYMGTVEAACALKLISNLVGMTNLAVLAEGIRIGEKAGIEPKYLLELLGDTGAKSFQMDVRGPWIATGDFNSRFGLDLALKDVRLGVEMAKAWGNDARTMQVALDYLKQGSANGLGKEDCNAIYKIIK